jgi:predicted amidohydrolase YtcJ
MSADKIFYNGVILTIDDQFQIAEAIAVKDGRVDAVGSNETVLAHAGTDTVRIDLQGKTVVPGIIDAHGHFGQILKGFTRIEVITPNYFSTSLTPITAVIDRLKRQSDAEDPAATGWIVGFGYHESGLAEKRFIDKFDLDQVSLTRPVVVANTSFHTFSFNSAGLALLGIGPDTPDIPTSKIERTGDGKTPNGVIRGSLGQEFFFNLPIGNHDEIITAFEKTQAYYFAAGVTTAQEGKSTASDIEILALAAAAGKIKIDIASFVDYASIDAVLEKYPFRVGEVKDHVLLSGIKIISDGTLISGAYLTKPFLNVPDSYGIQYVSKEALEENIRKALRGGWQFCVHAMGDAAIDKLLDAYEKAAAEEGIRLPAGRHIINHGSAVRKDQLPRIRRLGLTLSLYPSAVCRLYEGFCISIGPERAAHSNPVRSALEERILVTAHNDAPVLEPNPWIIFWALVNRKSILTGTAFAPEERVDAKEALRILTINGAKQYGQEDIKGSLEAGKQADFVILDRDPLTIDPDDARYIRTLETVKDGVTVYLREDETE